MVVWLAQSHAYMTGTKPWLCGWHKVRAVWLAQRHGFLAGTRPWLYDWHKAIAMWLRLAQSHGCVAGTKSGLCGWHKAMAVWLAQHHGCHLPGSLACPSQGHCHRSGQHKTMVQVSIKKLTYYCDIHRANAIYCNGRVSICLMFDMCRGA